MTIACTPFTEWAERLVKKCNAGHSLSMVRLGDGEFVILKWPGITTRLGMHIQMRKWIYSKDYTENDVAIIRNGILTACQNANFLGIPSEYEQRVWVKWRGFADEARRFDIDSRGLRFHFYEIATLWEKGHVARILEKRPFVGIISSRDVAPLLKKKFGIKATEQILIPSERFRWHKVNNGLDDLDAAYKGPRHWPDMYEQIKNRFTGANEHGKLWLVGAGGFGKIYCEWIRAAGGMALDLGALFDGWVGIATRPYLAGNIDRYDLR